jgi:hypothetical protein
MIEVRVPSKATTGPVEVWSGKTKTKAGTFTVQQPTIHSISPAEIEAGAVIQIIGEHFGDTAGSKDLNTMFGVNDVTIGGVSVRPRRWRDSKIEVEVPANAASGEVQIRLASSDPLPDGSCCVPVTLVKSNVISMTILPSVRVDPLDGPVGTKVVLFGKGFGETKGPADAILIAGHQATVSKWADEVIVVHVPLDAESGPLILKRGDRTRQVGMFTVHQTTASGIAPVTGPTGTLLRIKGEHFGYYSESGATPYSFLDFNKGINGVEIGGVPAAIYRWHDDRIEVWVPFSAKSGKVVVRRGGNRPKPDGSCCLEEGKVEVVAGEYTVVSPVIESYEPKSSPIDGIVTITGRGFGSFVRNTDATQPGLNEGAHEGSQMNLLENVARCEVLFNGIAAPVLSWTDTEIKVRVPRRHVYGIGKPNQFVPDLTTGPLIVRRGAIDLLPDGNCCTAKKWLTLEAGTFTILAKNLPDQGFFDPQPGRE